MCKIWCPPLSVRRRMRAFGDVRTTYGRKRKRRTYFMAHFQRLSLGMENQCFFKCTTPIQSRFFIITRLPRIPKHNRDNDGLLIVTLCMVPNIPVKRSFSKTDKVPLDKFTLVKYVGTSIPRSECDVRNLLWSYGITLVTPAIRCHK